MKIFEQAKAQPELVAEWLVKNEQEWQVLVRQECRHSSHKLHLLTRRINLSAGDVLPCKIFEKVESCLTLIGELESAPTIFASLSQHLKEKKLATGHRRTIFAKPNKSLELLEFILQKSDHYILNPKTTVVRDMREAPAFLEMLHRSYNQTEDRIETAININYLCERIVDIERWQKLKNNFTSWQYNKANEVKGLSITGEAAKSLKDIQAEIGLSSTSETVLHLVEQYKKNRDT